eukprot:3302547-Pyramimonas_sp.AAC.1
MRGWVGLLWRRECRPSSGRSARARRRPPREQPAGLRRSPARRFGRTSGLGEPEATCALRP